MWRFNGGFTNWVQHRVLFWSVLQAQPVPRLQSLLLPGAHSCHFLPVTSLTCKAMQALQAALQSLWTWLVARKKIWSAKTSQPRRFCQSSFWKRLVWPIATLAHYGCGTMSHVVTACDWKLLNRRKRTSIGSSVSWNGAWNCLKTRSVCVT